ncbi:hypothetical protein T492DRAFT_885777 [Pavlovales sp. CCMP2436]|nr:hypothetical protein T492DRAFT_885777 [Pavlovales sp. CCMP2436]
MGWASQLFSYLPLLLAVYSAWTSGGYTPLLQFALTIFVGRLLSTALSSQLQLMFMAKMSLWVLFQVSLVPGAIVLGAYFSGCSMQMLSSCLFTAFLFPAARRKYPKGGPMAIAAFIVASVSYAWQAFGISPYLVFLVFMQALPELQRALWIGGPTRTRAHVALVATVCLLASPFAAMGGVALYEPQLLTRLSDGQLRALCYASNGCPSIDHRDLYAALGLSKYASPHEVPSSIL